jgi:hypothetical protein
MSSQQTAQELLNLMFVMDVGTLQFINSIEETGIGVLSIKGLPDNSNVTHQ